MTDSEARKRLQVRECKKLEAQLRADIAKEYDWMAEKLADDLALFIQATDVRK